MYLGRRQLGQRLPLGIQCRDASGTPTAPSVPPFLEIWSGTTLVLSQEMPIRDRYSVTGLFHFKQFLDSRFAAGFYQVLYHYVVGSHVGIDADEFEIVAGGNDDGSIIAMTYFQKPQAGFIVYQTDAGLVLQGRNPHL